MTEPSSLSTRSRRTATHIAIFSSMHPLDDPRVYSKFARSFLASGARLTWVGPDALHFGDGARDSRIEYRTVASPKSLFGRLRGLLRLVRIARQVDGVDWWYVPDPDAALALTHLVPQARGRVIFDLHEQFHTGHMDRWVGVGRAKTLREIVRRLISRACSRSALVVGVSENIIEPYAGNASKVVVVRNFAPSQFGETSRVDSGGTTTFFHGKAARNNGTQVVLESARLLAVNPASRRATLILIDVGIADSTQQARSTSVELSHPSIRVIDRLPHDDMPALLATCDVGLIGYGRDLGVDSLPNRLFEYMAAGLAVLAPSYSRLIEPILAEGPIGLAADFEDPQDVARALTWMLANPDEVRAMGERARSRFLHEFSWEAEFRRLWEIMCAESVGKTAL